MIGNRYSEKKPWWQISALVFVLSLTGNVIAQDDAEAEAGDEAVDLNRIVVTGSRIKKTDLEGASPVVVITAADMEEQGFVTVFDALSNITQSTGVINSEAFTNQFTAGAPALNLRGLGPGRTLILLNGRRFADYPFPYDGQSNFVNLQRVPTAAVDRIEILAGGASAIYGSDAVAGVINIVTKTNYDGHTVSARYGSTTEGEGDNYRVQMVGGFAGDRWSAVYALEYFDRDPIFGNDRDYLDEVSDFPQLLQVNTRSLLYISDRFGFDLDGDGYSYEDPGEAACDPFVDLEYSFRPPSSGYYCGRDSIGDESIRNQRTHWSIYASLNFEVTDTVTLFADILYGDGETESTGFRRWWGSPGNVFWNPGDTTANAGVGAAFASGPAAGGLLQRIFQPSETGNQAATYDEESIDITVGLRGSFGETSLWEWEGSYHHSQYDSKIQKFYFKEELIDAYFLGTHDPSKDAFGYEWWDVPSDWYERFYTPMTPAQIDELSGLLTDPADASVDTLQFVINGDLFEMPAGPVGFAAVAEWSTQEYQLRPDERTLDKTGNGWWGRSGTGGGGERDRYAFGAEFSVPVFNTLTLPLAVRYDKYKDDSDVDDAVTWKAGFEYRPMQELLIRGTIGTSFRAPDMHYLFAGDSGFFNFVRDYYLCRRDEPGVPYTACTFDSTQIAGNRQGNINLEEEEGDSFTIGFAWEAFENFTITADLYKIELEGIVNDLSIDNLLQDEADCRLGVTVGGQSVDGNSVECQRILARIQRNPAPPGSPGSEQIQEITVGPINRSLQDQTGIDASVSYTILTERMGDWNLRANYTHILESTVQEFPEDEADDQWRDHKQNFEFRHRFNASVGWNKGDWNTVVTALHKGSVPNWGETERLPTQWTFNMMVAWSITDDVTVSVFGNNITNERPPKDPTFDTWPGFYRGSYDAIGRELWGQIDWSFGRN